MDTPQKRRVTQRDIARHAGVSQATVSMVLSGSSSSSLPAETWEQVQQAARDLGYAPNRWAQALKTRRTLTIGCVVPDILNPFYPSLLRGLQAVADDAGYDVIVVNTGGTAEREQRLIQWSLEGRVDGIVGVFSTLRAGDFKPVTDADVSVVRIEPRRKVGGWLPIDNLYVDNEAAAAEVTRHLVGRGYRRIAMVASIGSPQDCRRRGYEAALVAAGGTPIIITDQELTAEGGHRAARVLLAMSARPDAIFAADDLMAIGAMAAVRAAGLSIPGDIAIAGFDDIFAAQLVTPALTTVSQFQYDVGMTAAKMLLDRMQRGNAPSATTQPMPFRIIERAST